MADLAQNSFYHNSEFIEPVWKYEYDAIYRLIHATGREHAGQNASVQHDVYGSPLVNAPNPNDPLAMRNYAETYQYDRVSNFEEVVHSTLNSAETWTRNYTSSATSNRLTAMSLSGAGSDPYTDTYVPNTLSGPNEHGSMQQLANMALTWDFKEQLAHVNIANGQDVYFTYDASGQRIRKVWVHSGITEERIYLGGFEIYRRHENGDVVLERETLHVMDDSRRIAMVETKTVDTSVPNLNVVSRIRYQCSNHLGSAILEVDEAGLVISYEEYHPYGTSAYRATNGNVDVPAKRSRYTGKERDEETGLYYHGARYYACWLGRWTSADPAGMVDGVNLFAYVRNSPISLHDPSGMEGAAALQNEVPGAVEKIKQSANAAQAHATVEGRAVESAARVEPTCLPLSQLRFMPVSPGIFIHRAEGRMAEVQEVNALTPHDIAEVTRNESLDRIFLKDTSKEYKWAQSYAKIHGETRGQRHERRVNELILQISVGLAFEGFAAWGTGRAGLGVIEANAEGRAAGRAASEARAPGQAPSSSTADTEKLPVCRLGYGC